MIIPADQKNKDAEENRDRIVLLYGSVMAESSLAVIHKLLSLNSESHEPIHLYLNSGGGCVINGLSIIDTMQHIESPVYTYCIGLCASMAAVILAAGEKGHRYILPHSKVMIHQGSGSVAGKMEDLKATLALQTSLENETDAVLAQCTGHTIETIHKETRVDHWMNADEARRFGIVDMLLDRSKTKPLQTKEKK